MVFDLAAGAISGINFGIGLLGKGAARRAQAEAAQAQYDFGVKRANLQFQEQQTEINNAYRDSVKRWWADVVYTSQLRAYESQKRLLSANMGTELIASATEAFDKQTKGMQQRFIQDDQILGMRYQSAMLDNIRRRSSFSAAAAGRYGKSIDKLSQSFDSQMANVMYSFGVQQKWNRGGYLQQAKELESQMISRSNQWAPYISQEFRDPIAPNPPQTIKVIYPDKPNVGNAGGFLDFAGGLLGAVNQYQGMVAPAARLF